MRLTEKQECLVCRTQIEQETAQRIFEDMNKPCKKHPTRVIEYPLAKNLSSCDQYYPKKYYCPKCRNELKSKYGVK